MCSGAAEKAGAGEAGGGGSRIERDIGWLLVRVMSLPQGTRERVVPALAIHVCALVDQNVELLRAHSWKRSPPVTPPSALPPTPSRDP